MVGQTVTDQCLLIALGIMRSYKIRGQVAALYSPKPRDHHHRKFVRVGEAARGFPVGTFEVEQSMGSLVANR